MSPELRSLCECHYHDPTVQSSSATHLVGMKTADELRQTGLLPFLCSISVINNNIWAADFSEKSLTKAQEIGPKQKLIIKKYCLSKGKFPTLNVLVLCLILYHCASSSSLFSLLVCLFFYHLDSKLIAFYWSLLICIQEEMRTQIFTLRERTMSMIYSFQNQKKKSERKVDEKGNLHRQQATSGLRGWAPLPNFALRHMVCKSS